MARSRNIKPGFFTNELLGTADPMVCLTFAGLWCLADKHGILEDRPLRIKAELFPYRESLDVNGYLTVLAQLGFIQRYEVNGFRYIKVLHFRKHQSPHHTEKAKGYPEPDCDNSLISAGNRYDTVTSPCIDGKSQVPTRSDSLIPDSLIPDSPTHRADAQRRFAPPTPEEVSEYAAEAGIAIDGNRFVDFYASKGWKVGKTPMKDWQAAVRTWGRNADKPSESVRVWK